MQHIGRTIMRDTRIAKLFKNGASQAVRLPIEFRFDGNEVYITRDDATGDVVLSNRPGAKTWNEFFELLHSIEVPEDFMANRPMNVFSQTRGIFDDELALQSKKNLS
jgi:antitoxin VapB